MKGELYKTENGWGVKYFDHQEAHDVMYCGVRYPLHPDSIGKRDFGVLIEGSTVDFDVVNVYVEPSSDIHSNRGVDVPYAKLYKAQEEQIKDDVETARRVVLILAHDILRQAKRYVKAAEAVNTEGIEPFHESFISQLEVASYNLANSIKTAQMFRNYRK